MILKNTKKKSEELQRIRRNKKKEVNIVSHEIAEKTTKEGDNYPTDLERSNLDQIRLMLEKEETEYKN